MAITYKILGQSNPVANTATTLYTVPSLKSTVVSSIAICNQSATAAQFDIAVRQGGATLSAKQYINFQTSLPGNDTITISMGMTLAASDVVTVNSTTATVSFNLFGSEIE
jgi:hypothetical protein